MKIKNKKILISGAGVAGASLAYWLKQYGFSPTLVERAPELRVAGYKVDMRGAALEVVKRMNLHSSISAARTDMQGASVINAAGEQMAALSSETFGFRINEDLEIMRGDLCRILMEQISEVECLFGDSITALSQSNESVEVQFEKNMPRSFDLVIGADGLHSRVRKLVFGDEAKFLRELGAYISIFTVPNYLKLDRQEIEYAESGKIVYLFSSRGDSTAKAAFVFNSKPLALDLRNRTEQQKLLTEVFSGLAWEIPRLLEAMKDAPDFYFDSISQICMNNWSDGRIALVGDAGYCASPLSGQGTSLALVGAYVLAGELAEADGDYNLAFTRYEHQMRYYVEQNQNFGRMMAKELSGKNKHKVMAWLHEQLRRILPGPCIKYIAEMNVKRIAQAANAITLKNYLSS